MQRKLLLRSALFVTSTIAGFVTAGVTITGCASTNEIKKDVAIDRIPGGTMVTTTTKGDDHGEERFTLEMQAQVRDLDIPNQIITLVSAQGDLLTFRINDQAPRLSEVRVGDLVRVRYQRSTAFELRRPTKEEKRNPRLLTDSVQKTPLSLPPGLSGQRYVRAVVKIIALDRSQQSVTVRGPDGTLVSAWIRDPALFSDMDVGDDAVVSYTESALVSVERTEASRGSPVLP